MTILHSAAFFISPEGEIVKVKGNHICTVINDPERFGLTIDEIMERYKKYGEKMGIEGKAREEILTELIRKGWIRLRWYRNRYWSVTINKLSERTKKHLSNWAIRILKGINGVRESDSYITLNITTLENGVISKYTILEVANMIN